MSIAVAFVAPSTLQARYGGEEGEHPLHPRTQWRFGVAFSEHRLPYWAWVQREIDQAGGTAGLRSPEVADPRAATGTGPRTD